MLREVRGQEAAGVNRALDLELREEAEQAERAAKAKAKTKAQAKAPPQEAVA